MRRAVGLLAVLVLVVICNAQENRPKFTARTELVTVPVVVTRSGQFVSGLKQSDFTVLENDKPQTVAFFEEVHTQPVSSPVNAPGEFSNHHFRPAERPPLTIILLDRINTPVSEYNNMVDELKKFVSRYLQPGTPAMVGELNRQGLRVLQDFTTSPEFILDALNHTAKRLALSPGLMEDMPVQMTANGAPSATVPDSPTQDSRGAYDTSRGPSDTPIAKPIDIATQNIDSDAPTGNAQVDLLHEVIVREQQEETVTTLHAVEQIARSVFGIPGRKTLIFTSPGFGCPIRLGLMRDLRGKQVAIAEQCETVWRLLNQANISVYPVVPTQTENPEFSSTSHSALIQRNLMLQSYAAYTGGKVCTYRNDLDECYHRAAEDSLRYYLLSYYAGPTDTPVWRRIQVRVASPHASVRSRQWYRAEGPADETLPVERDLASAVVSPVEYAAIPMVVRWTGVTERDGKRRASFEIRISPETLTVEDPPNNRLRLEIAAIEMDAAGSVTNAVRHGIDRQLEARALHDLQAGGLNYTNAITIAPSAIRVKFVVRDAASGRIGTVNARVPRWR